MMWIYFNFTSEYCCVRSFYCCALAFNNIYVIEFAIVDIHPMFYDMINMFVEFLLFDVLVVCSFSHSSF